MWANAIPAPRSMAEGGLPIGLAHNVRLKRAVARDSILRWDDVELSGEADVVAVRRAMEQAARPASQAAE